MIVGNTISRARKGIDKNKVIEMYNAGMSVNDIHTALDISVATVYWHLRDVPKHGGGGAVAKTIPAHEIHKPVEEAVGKAAEANEANASVLLASCDISLAGCVGNYTVNTGEKKVRCEIGDSVLYFNIDDLLGLIEELKGVGRCIKHFDIGNVMW